MPISIASSSSSSHHHVVFLFLYYFSSHTFQSSCLLLKVNASSNNVFFPLLSLQLLLESHIPWPFTSSPPHTFFLSIKLLMQQQERTLVYKRFVIHLLPFTPASSTIYNKPAILLFLMLLFLPTFFPLSLPIPSKVEKVIIISCHMIIMSFPSPLFSPRRAFSWNLILIKRITFIMPLMLLHTKQGRGAHQQ